MGYNLICAAAIFATPMFAKSGKGGGHGHSVPELDPALIVGAVTLLAGGIAVIRYRRRQK